MKDAETIWVLEENDVFIARKVSGWSLRFGEERQGEIQKQKVDTDEVASNPYEPPGPACFLKKVLDLCV